MLPIGNTRTHVGQLHADVGTGVKRSSTSPNTLLLCVAVEYTQTYSLCSSIPTATGVHNRPTKNCPMVPLISAKLIKVVVAATLVRLCQFVLN